AQGPPSRKFPQWCGSLRGGAGGGGGGGGGKAGGGTVSAGAGAPRRHPGRPLSARQRAGLLRPSRPCPPRGHPPNLSIGPYLVIRPEADLALVVLASPALPLRSRSVSSSPHVMVFAERTTAGRRGETALPAAGRPATPGP